MKTQNKIMQQIRTRMGEKVPPWRLDVAKVLSEGQRYLGNYPICWRKRAGLECPLCDATARKKTLPRSS